MLEQFVLIGMTSKISKLIKVMFMNLEYEVWFIWSYLSVLNLSLNKSNLLIFLKFNYEFVIWLLGYLSVHKPLSIIYWLALLFEWNVY